MKVNPQYKVIGHYNYDRIIHNVEQIQRDKIEVTVKLKDTFRLKIKICVIGYSERFQTL